MKKKIKYPTTKKNKQFVEDYKRYIHILGYSHNGIQGKCANVGEFLAYLETRKIAVEKVRPVHINEHYAYMKTRPHAVLGGVLSLKTIAHHMQSIRHFYSFLQQRGDIVKHPMSTLVFKHPSKRIGAKRTILTLEEIQTLYTHCEWLHERCILGLAYGCGLRRMEIINVNVEDIKFNEGILIVTKGKGNKRRVVPMSAGVVRDFRSYYENERSQFIKKDHERSFLLNTLGDRMQGPTCRDILKRITNRTGDQTIKDKNISLHNLRHSIATHLLEQGVHIEQVRNFLGHAHIETTEIYTRVNQEQLKKLIL